MIDVLSVLFLLVAAPQIASAPYSADSPLPPVSATGLIQYPQRAMAEEVTSGAVTLNCEVSADGRLNDCRIVSEEPAGLGFGEAALAGSRRARLGPDLLARVGAGARASYTTRFMVAGSAPAADIPADARP